MKGSAERSSPTGLTAATGRTAPDAGAHAFLQKPQLDEAKKRSSRGGKGRPRKEKSREDLSGRSSSPDETPALLDVEPEPVPSGGVPLASHDSFDSASGAADPEAAIRHVPATKRQGSRGSRGGKGKGVNGSTAPPPGLDRASSTGVPPAESSPALTPAPLDVGRSGRRSSGSLSPQEPLPAAAAAAHAAAVPPSPSRPASYVPAVPVPPSPARSEGGGDPIELTAPAERIEEELTDVKLEVLRELARHNCTLRDELAAEAAERARAEAHAASLSSARQEHEHALREVQADIAKLEAELGRATAEREAAERQLAAERKVSAAAKADVTGATAGGGGGEASTDLERRLLELDPEAQRRVLELLIAQEPSLRDAADPNAAAAAAAAAATPPAEVAGGSDGRPQRGRGGKNGKYGKNGGRARGGGAAA